MKLQFRCKCGLTNHNLEDWLTHWKYSDKGKLYAIKLFLLTRVEVKK